MPFAHHARRLARLFASYNPGRRGLRAFTALVCVVAISLPVVRGQVANNEVKTFSAASYAPLVAPDSIAAAFGQRLATRTEAATTQPLPTSLAGTTVRVNGRLPPRPVPTPSRWWPRTGSRPRPRCSP